MELFDCIYLITLVKQHANDHIVCLHIKQDALISGFKSSGDKTTKN